MYLSHVGCRFFSECFHKVYCETLDCWSTKYVYRIRFHKMFSQNVLRNMGMHHRMLISQLLSQKCIHQIYGPGNGFDFKIFVIVFHKVYTPSVFGTTWSFCNSCSFTKCKHQVYCKLSGPMLNAPNAYVHWYSNFESVLWKIRSPTCSLFDWPKGLWRCSMLSNFRVLIHKGLCIHSKVSNKKVRTLHQL